MNITCLKKNLIESVDISSKIISTKPTLPVLSCVLLDAQEDRVYIKSTNLEFSIQTSFIAEVESTGRVAIPANIFVRVLKTIRSNSNINLYLDGESVIIKTDDGTTTINTLPIDEFPNIPKPDTDNKFKIDPKILLNGIKSVSQSASLSVIKPELASVYIYYENNNLVFVSTDQFRLSEKRIQLKIDQDIPSVIIPITNANELAHVLDSIESDIYVYIDENQISIESDNIYATARIIDGSFPDYKAIIPTESTTKAIILKNDFINTLQKMQIFSDKFGKTNIHIYPSKKTFTTSARNNELGEVFDSPDAVLEGEDLDIAFNHKYLYDSLQSISSDSLELLFAGVGKPLVIKGVDDKTFTYLVMPMNR